MISYFNSAAIVHKAPFTSHATKKKTLGSRMA